MVLDAVPHVSDQAHEALQIVLRKVKMKLGNRKSRGKLRRKLVRTSKNLVGSLEEARKFQGGSRIKDSPLLIDLMSI